MTGPSIDNARWEQLYPGGELYLGGGERLRFTTDGQAHLLGAIHDHPRRRPADHPPDTGWHTDDFSCSGGIWFDVPEVTAYETADKPRPRWQIVQEYPLTLSPAVLCTTCGDHGFVVQGEWRPA